MTSSSRPNSMKSIHLYRCNLFKTFFVKTIFKQETVRIVLFVQTRRCWTHCLHWSRDSQSLIHLTSRIIIAFLPSRLLPFPLCRTSFLSTFQRHPLFLFLQTPTNYHYPAGLLFPPSLPRGFSPNSLHNRAFFRHSALPSPRFQPMAASIHVFSRHPAGSTHFPPTHSFPRKHNYRLSTRHRSRHLPFSRRFPWRELSTFPPSPIFPPSPRFSPIPLFFPFPPSSDIPAVVPSNRGFSRQLSPNRPRCR